MKTIAIFILTITGLMMCAPFAGATTIPYMDLDTMVARADGIIIGDVNEIDSFKDESGMIFTDIELVNIEMVKGRYDEAQFTVRQVGGRVDDEVLVIQGAPKFRVGERVLLFLEGNGDAQVPIQGFGLGVFRTRRDNSHEIVTDGWGNRIFGFKGKKIMKEIRERRAGAHYIGERNYIEVRPKNSKMRKRRRTQTQERLTSPGVPGDGEPADVNRVSKSVAPAQILELDEMKAMTLEGFVSKIKEMLPAITPHQQKAVQSVVRGETGHQRHADDERDTAASPPEDEDVPEYVHPSN